MSRLAASVFAIACSLLSAAAWATQEPTAIRSKAALTRYLHDTPAGESPLDHLSPGGRKRFLAGLEFGERGMTSMSMDDPAHELTHPQIVRLFSLFDAEAYAAGLGLTPAKQARLARERADDATARGCVIETCPESAIEQRYDTLVLQPSDRSLPTAKRRAAVARRYDRLFANHPSPAPLRSISRPDLRLLKRAAEYVAFSAPSRAHLAQLQMDLAEMQRRNMADDSDYRRLHQALLATRQFADAATLAQQHPGVGGEIIPTLHRGNRLPKDSLTALTLGPQGQTMTREAFDLATPLRIVVIASCHFSQDAARAIAADAQLRRLFSDHAIWLAGQNESFGAAVAWNHEFPTQPIHIAWQNSEWPMLDTWAMPTFYVFQHGQLTGKFSGWHGLKTLKKSLHDAGAVE